MHGRLLGRTEASAGVLLATLGMDTVMGVRICCTGPSDGAVLVRVADLL